MSRIMAILMLFSLALSLCACVVEPVGAGPPGAHWVPGHYGPYGDWHPGHWAP